MSEDAVGSALLRRYIGRRFQALRLRAGLTQEQVAAALQRSRSTVARLEDGDERVRFRDIDVREHLRLYEATEQDVEMLLALTAETRNGRRKSWWHDYTETALPQWLRLYVSLEDSAERIRNYQPELVPGLLQTRAYADHLHRALPGYLDDEDEIQRRIDVRMKRQTLLTRPRAPHLAVILNEAVLHRPVGGRTLMAEQLAHLLKASEQANISVRVLPYSVGLHGGMYGGSAFMMLEFPDDPVTGQPLEPPLVYVDYLTGAVYLTKPDAIHAHRIAWEDLDRRALDEPESRAAIANAMRVMTPD